MCTEVYLFYWEKFVRQRIQKRYTLLDVTINQKLWDNKICLTFGVKNILNVQQVNLAFKSLYNSSYSYTHPKTRLTNTKEVLQRCSSIKNAGIAMLLTVLPIIADSVEVCVI